MRCTFLPGGVIVCGGRTSKSCSTPGCRGRVTKSCDHPVKRAHESEQAPKRGDCRVHRERGVLFFVWGCDGETVTISRQDPNGSLEPGPVQVVPIDDWWTKSDPTCDRPICDRCAVAVGSLEYCGAHARAAKEQA